MRGPCVEHPVFDPALLEQAYAWLNAHNYVEPFRRVHMKAEWMMAEQVLNMEEFKISGSEVTDTYIVFHLMDMIDECDEESYHFGCFMFKLWQHVQHAHTLALN